MDFFDCQSTFTASQHVLDYFTHSYAPGVGKRNPPTPLLSFLSVSFCLHLRQVRKKDNRESSLASTFSSPYCCSVKQERSFFFTVLNAINDETTADSQGLLTSDSTFRIGHTRLRNERFKRPLHHLGRETPKQIADECAQKCPGETDLGCQVCLLLAEMLRTN